MKRFVALVLVALFAGLPRVRADGPDDQYLQIYYLVQEADSLNSSGQPARALEKYRDAQVALQTFRNGYPDWNVPVVKFRLNYIASRIAAIPVTASIPTAVAVAVAPAAASASKVGGVTDAPVPGSVSAPALSAGLENQLNDLKEQVRQLTANKSLLEAKLKEAFAAQPAAVDPRELAKAQAKLDSLAKENDLLKVSLAQEQSKPASVSSDAKALAKTQQALTEANRNLADQTPKATALADANRQLALQKETSTRLSLEKDALQSRLTALSADGEAAAALRSENLLLKKELASLQAVPPSTGKPEDASRSLALAEAKIAALQSDNEILRLEKTALGNRVKQLSTTTITSTVIPAVGPSANANHVRQLEQERDDLQKKLDAANKSLYGRKGKVVAPRVEELESQVATLQARLQVFEARQVPYTAEELALFQANETKLAEPNAGKKSAKELPVGTTQLFAEAERYFSQKQLDKAEDAYLQALRQDNRNIFTLANLASIELELNHWTEAEKYIKQALAIAPDDAYSLSVLGRLRFRQAKYDEALDVLSRAAKLDPQSAEIQNYLGITLAQKSMRGPAEIALRKAIQLRPDYGDAHYNLAVIYIMQQPPMVELARWHYQRVLAAGHERNPDIEKLFEEKKATP